MYLPKRNRIDGNKKIIFREKYKNYINQGKPNGFWYSCYNSWYNCSERLSRTKCIKWS